MTVFKQQHYIDRINAARAAGIDVTVNQYPYTAMQHPWSVFFPDWARAKGPDAFAKMLKDPAIQKKIKADKDFKDWMAEHGGPAGITYTRAPIPEIRREPGVFLIPRALEQSTVVMAHTAQVHRADSRDYFASSIGNSILGAGGLSSRLMERRQEQGMNQITIVQLLAKSRS